MDSIRTHPEAPDRRAARPKSPGRRSSLETFSIVTPSEPRRRRSSSSPSAARSLANRDLDGLAIPGSRPQQLAVFGDMGAPDQRHRIFRAGDTGEVRFDGRFACRGSRRLHPFPQEPMQYLRRPAGIVAWRSQNPGDPAGRQVHGARGVVTLGIRQPLQHTRGFQAVDRPPVGVRARSACFSSAARAAADGHRPHGHANDAPAGSACRVAA